MWWLSFSIISVVTVIWAVCNIVGIELSDMTVRIMGVLDICAMPVLIYASIKKKTDNFQFVGELHINNLFRSNLNDAFGVL